MICLMPFTYIEAEKIAVITGALGPVRVCALLPETVPDHMRSLAEQQVLSMQYSQGLRADDLKRAMAEFKAWADMHRGKISEMIAFQKIMSGRVPFVDETHPTQLGDQIRHFSESSPQETADPLFKSALFLFMAQEHDRQEDAVARDLGAVQAMEQEMLARLSGRDRQGGRMLSEDSPGAEVPIHNPDLGVYMTAQRIQAWARMTSGPNCVCSAYITTSPAVYTLLLDAFPEAGAARIFRPDDKAQGADKLSEALDALSQASNPDELPSEAAGILPAGAGITDLTLAPLVGVPPGVFLDRLSGRPSKAAPAAGGRSTPLHTIIGLLNLS